MKLKTITVKNFLSFGNEPETLNLNNLGLTLITGQNEDSSGMIQNGVGKSALLEAIVYALYGELANGIKNDNIINDAATKHLMVKLQFEQAGHNYEITRFRNKGQSKRLLTRDGEDITPKGLYDTTQMMTKIIGLGRKTFVQANMFGLGGITSFTNANDADKKEVLENLMNLNIYRKARKKTQEKIEKQEQEMTKIKKQQADNNDLNIILQNKIISQEKLLKQQVENNFEQQVNLLKANLSELKQKIKVEEEHWEKEEQHLKARFKQLTDQLDNNQLEKNTKEKQEQELRKQILNIEQVNHLKSEKQDIEHQMKALKDSRDLDRAKRTKISEELNDFQTQITQCNVELKGHKDQLDQTKSELKKAQKGYLDAKDNSKLTCSVCGSRYTHESRKHEMKHFEQKKQAKSQQQASLLVSIQKDNQKVADLDLLLIKTQKELEKNDTSLDIVDDITDLNNKYNVIDKKLSNNQHNLKLANNLKANVTYFLEQIKSINKELDALNLEIKVHEKTNQNNNNLNLTKYKTQVTEAEKGLSQLKAPTYLKQAIKDSLAKDKDLVALQKQFNDVQTEKLNLDNKSQASLNMLEVLEKIKEMYSDHGIISFVLENSLPEINKYANHYLETLSGGTITVDISAQTEHKDGKKVEKLAIQVDNQNGKKGEYGLNSTGERKRIDIAIALALQDYILNSKQASTNLVAYDEVFDGVDEIGIEEVVEILKQRLHKVPNIMVISHNPTLKGTFEKEIKVNKKHGISHFKVI